MNSTSQNPEHKFPLGSEPNVRTLYLTLAVSVGLTLLLILLLYASYGRNPLNRLGFGFFVSVLPALGTLLFLKLTKRFASWRGVAIIYLVLFIVLLIIQAIGRLIPLYN